MAWLSGIAMSRRRASDLGRTVVRDHHRESIGKPAGQPRPAAAARTWSSSTLAILVLLTATKNIYMASISSYFTFYVIERFSMGMQESQLMLFLFLGAPALGTLVGGPIGDRFGARFVIWFSILGVIPLALLLPYADLFWTCVLSVVDRPHLRIGLPGHRGVRAATGAGQGRHDRRPVLRPGFRRGWLGRRPAGHRGRRAGH